MVARAFAGVHSDTGVRNAAQIVSLFCMSTKGFHARETAHTKISLAPPHFYLLVTSHCLSQVSAYAKISADLQTCWLVTSSTMPAATHGMIDPDGPWRPSTSQRNVNLSSQYYPSHPAAERVLHLTPSCNLIPPEYACLALLQKSGNAQIPSMKTDQSHTLKRLLCCAAAYSKHIAAAFVCTLPP